MKYSFLLLLFLSFFIISCSSDDDNSPTPEEVTYAKSIKPIIDNSCLSCHGNPVTNGAPMSLTNFDEVKDAVINKDLIGRVESGSMPLGGTPLTAAQITAIKDWKEANYPQ